MCLVKSSVSQKHVKYHQNLSSFSFSSFCVLCSKASNVASKPPNVASKASNVGSVPSNMHYTELRLQRYNIEKAMSRVCFVKES